MSIDPNVSVNDRKTLLFKVEQDLARLLLDKMESFQMSFERASQIAKFVLAHFPENLTDQQVIQFLPSLDNEFYELAGVVHKYMDEYEQKYKLKITNQVQDLIKHEHFEEANKLMNDYLEKKFTPQ